MANIYTCTNCHRGYQRKNYYNRHVALCEIMSKSVKERQLENEEHADTPTVRALYEVIMELTTKMSKMEKQLQELAKWTDAKKRKINIVDWLNENPMASEEKPKPWEEFLTGLTVERRHLEQLFQTDYPSAFAQVLQDHLPLHNDTTTIKAFEQKNNMLFVYSNNLWLLMSEQLLKNLVYTVDKKLLAEFVRWQQENTVNMEQDEFAVKYALNVKKIMGGSLSREQIHSRVKIDLYKYLKVNIKSVTEYEFI